jgi:hypothetical protein
MRGDVGSDFGDRCWHTEIDWPKYEYCLSQRRQYAVVGQETVGAAGGVAWFRRRLGQTDR